ncbi:MAG: hypothetical protein V1918_03185 [Planctomycetota bacterium]
MQPARRCFAAFLLALLSAWAASPKGAAGEKPGFEPSRIQTVLSENLNLDRWKTDGGLAAIVPLPTGQGNAAGHYAALDALYPKEKGPNGLTVPENAQGISHILAASRIQECRLVPDYYLAMVTFNPPLPSAPAFQAYVRATLRRAEACRKNGLFQEAEELYRAVIVMGWHLTEDRPNLLVYFLGLLIQEDGCRSYAEYLRSQMKSVAARKIMDYARFLRNARLQVRKKNAILTSWGQFDSLLSCIRCATEDKDPLWRQEACLSLGVLANGAPDSEGKLRQEPLQQRLAQNTLELVAKNDPRPNLRELARWCVDKLPQEIEKVRKEQKASGLGAGD